jgi:hypothetical protein
MTPPGTGPIPLCLRLQEAAESLEFAAVVLEDATELPQPADTINEACARLGVAVFAARRALTALHELADGKLSAKEGAFDWPLVQYCLMPPLRSKVTGPPGERLRTAQGVTYEI